MNATILVAISAAIVAPLLTYVIAARRMSGKIQTSEASDLWAESRALRDDYKSQVGMLQTQVKDLISRVRELEENKTTLEKANLQLARRVDDLENELASVKKENQALRADIEEKREELAEKEKN